MEQKSNLVHPEILSTVAAVVAEAPRAVDEGLLRKGNQVPGGQEVGALQGPDSTEGPTRAANGLIFDWGDLEISNIRLVKVSSRV